MIFVTIFSNILHLNSRVWILFSSASGASGKYDWRHITPFRMTKYTGLSLCSLIRNPSSCSCRVQRMWHCLFTHCGRVFIFLRNCLNWCFIKTSQIALHHDRQLWTNRIHGYSCFVELSSWNLDIQSERTHILTNESNEGLGVISDSFLEKRGRCGWQIRKKEGEAPSVRLHKIRLRFWHLKKKENTVIWIFFTILTKSRWVLGVKLQKKKGYLL